MKEEEMRCGGKVLIRSGSKTERTHTMTSTMRKMVGTNHTICKIESTQYGRAAVIDSYYWHPGDFISLDGPSVKIKRSKTVLFDINELI